MPPPLEIPQRVALVHEWFTSMRGGEKCVEALCEMFPRAEVFVLFHKPGSVSPTIERMPIHTSFIQHLPLARKHFRRYLPLFPRAVEQFDLTAFDLVISSHHCVAKGVRVPPHALHLSYCHTPMRYIWGQYDEYFGKGRAGALTRLAMSVAVGRLRRWDMATAGNPHHFIANSANVQERIRRIYHRDSDVIHPPVDTSRFRVSPSAGDYYLVVSALVPYKRIDLAVEACTKTQQRLVIVGDGPEERRLKSRAGPTIEFLGWQPDAVVADLYNGCTAVLFPGEEDFGIVPLEAMASGKPVVAFARGGALETVLEEDPPRTGVLFKDQTTNALLDAMRRCHQTEFEADALRAFAMKFDREVYKKNMFEYIAHKWEAFTSGRSQLAKGE